MFSQTSNPYFKRPSGYVKPRRSPTPPRAYIEPLSPPSSKPQALEPSFNYPAINNNVSFTVHRQPPPPTQRPVQYTNGFKATPRPRAQSSAQPRGHHHRTPSTIDTLAEAALALSPSYVSPASRPTQNHSNGFARPAPYQPHNGASEPPHKRARSDFLPSPLVGQYGSRPATSYQPSGWSSQAPNNQSSYDSRVEEAALLLNFRTGGWPSATTTHSHPAPMPSAAGPHANSFPQDMSHQRPIEQPVTERQSSLLPPFNPQQQNNYLPPTYSSPQRTSEGIGMSPKTTNGHAIEHPGSYQQHSRRVSQAVTAPQQTQTPPDEPNSRAPSTDVTMSEASEAPPKRRGWPKGKPRAGQRKAAAEKPAKRVARQSLKAQKARDPFAEVAEEKQQKSQRRNSFGGSRASEQPEQPPRDSRAASVPTDFRVIPRRARKQNKVTPETVCAGCNSSRESANPAGELDEWISCNGCKKWFHTDCAGFKKAIEIRDVDKYFCSGCEATHGKTTYVRKSTRAHTSVDYAELQRGVLKTSEESNEHHYIQPIKDGTFTFDPEMFPRMRPELVTRDFLERSGTFVEPICIPAEWNPRPWDLRKRAEEAGAVNGHTEDELPVANACSEDVNMVDADEFEYDSVMDAGQDKLDMVMPEGLTVRQVCELVGPDMPLDVIDVKTQNSGAKMNLKKWADYYEEDTDDKPIRNVISLEVSQSKLGRLLRRPKVVRDIDLQDEVWPEDEKYKNKWPRVQYYCLMSIKDSYTDFHIDFGGSSVYYHILKGKKTFFFIPPKPKHLKAYEEWNDSPQQNFTFLPHITKECYRVDLNAGDTMLIPSGWIHSVWTPETSLVIGGNFLTRLSFKNQFRIVDIEKNNNTPQKFRYPHFQRIMWYTAIKYLQDDPLPQAVSQAFYDGKQFQRDKPIWEDLDGDLSELDTREGAHNVRYYSQAEIEGLPELVNFIFRTVMLVMGRVEGITADRIKRVNASIPKGYGEPLEVAKTFALWVAWKRGNEDPPSWAHPDSILPSEKGEPKKLSERAIKAMERKEAIAAHKLVAPDRQSRRVQDKAAKDAAAAGTASPAPAGRSEDAPANSIANFQGGQHVSAKSSPPYHIPSNPPYGHHYSDIASSQSFAPQSAMMMNAFPAQFISTPKTSVLGPKRVACDACRKRRIRCKHKDMVTQAPMPVSLNQYTPNGSDNFFASHQSEVGENITVSPLQSREQQAQQYYQAYAAQEQQTNDRHSQSPAPNGVMANGSSLHQNGEQSQQWEHATPSTNSYMNSNIPMTMNGVSMFGDAVKRGRSKACFECRKSKRRCIHDDKGNVDPVKAAETPVPRGSVSSKKRSAEDGSPSGSNKKPKPLEPALPNEQQQPTSAPQMQGMHGVLKPMNVNRPMKPVEVQPAQKAPVETYHKLPGEFYHPGTTNGEQHHSPPTDPNPQHRASNGSAPPIDPSLFSMHSDFAPPNPYPSHSYYPDHSTSAERPPLYALPSLEQIANDVLDMDGRGDDGAEAGLAAIQAFNRQQQHDFIHAYPQQSFEQQDPHEASQPDGSVDSGVSMSAPETDQKDASLTNGHGDALTPTEPAANTEAPQVEEVVVHHGLSAVPTTSHDESNAEAATSPSADRRSSFAQIPLYQPPAAPVKSPETTRAQPNGTTAASPSSPNKRKRESFTFSSSDKLRRQSREVSQPLIEEDEDTRFARLLQQDEMGLRRRMS